MLEKARTATQFIGAMKATKPGQYIHSTFTTIETLADGEVFIMLSFDNYSRFCFQPALCKELTEREMENHITGLVSDIKKQHPGVKPHIYFSYGKKFIESLNEKMKDRCTLEFNPIIADEIALPEARLFLESISKRK
ncbi:MAG: hypothetical protein J0H85_15975 [Sediminibacterium magnilacihabitans]|nr:hypothetical protein [Sediminibacterium magnilacihabitans]PQV58025.1 hypothetical protein CLV53_12410 [Sediminibacterium magnilacihabitans]